MTAREATRPCHQLMKTSTTIFSDLPEHRKTLRPGSAQHALSTSPARHFVTPSTCPRHIMMAKMRKIQPRRADTRKPTRQRDPLQKTNAPTSCAALMLKMLSRIRLAPPRE